MMQEVIENEVIENENTEVVSTIVLRGPHTGKPLNQNGHYKTPSGDYINAEGVSLTSFQKAMFRYTAGKWDRTYR